MLDRLNFILLRHLESASLCGCSVCFVTEEVHGHITCSALPLRHITESSVMRRRVLPQALCLKTSVSERVFVSMVSTSSF